MGAREWKMVVVALVALIAGMLLAGRGVLPAVQAQIGGQAGNVICVVGQERNGYAPIVVVDTREETLLAYRYSYSDYTIEFTSARTYNFDKQMKEFNIKGVSVGAVAGQVTGRR